MRSRYYFVRCVFAVSILVAMVMASCAGSEPTPPKAVGVRQAALDDNVITEDDCPPGSNVIIGTDGDDVLDGTRGDDCILGLGGDDVIDADRGDDFIAGGAGDDWIWSGSGTDVVYGEAGDDTIKVGSGFNSVVYGGSGNDRISTLGGWNLSAFGDDGHDIIIGGWGGDELVGGHGNDIIYGSFGRDTTLGGACHDIIIGGWTWDTSDGGDGVDACNRGDNCEMSTRDIDRCDVDADCADGQWCAVQTGLCVPWTPDGQDENGNSVCDGVDDDCDDLVDEDYVPVPSSCGVGACAATGELICVDGESVDTCEPGQPAADDATCDAVDDDCNGVADDGYVSQATSCEVGGCLAEGAMVCVQGQEQDTCLTDPVCVAEIDCVDESDNDGDGAIDCDDSDCAILDICQEANIGDPCLSNDDCPGIDNGVCLTESQYGYPGGYCSAECADASCCPDGSILVNGLCMLPCVGQNQCENPEHTCYSRSGAYQCTPVCTDNSDCQSGICRRFPRKTYGLCG